MRMGAFLLGGLCGAAAVIYWSRNSQNNMLFSSAGLLGRTIFGQAADQGKSQSGKPSAASHRSGNESSGGGLEAVKNTISEDSKLGEQVAQILEENKETQYKTH